MNKIRVLLANHPMMIPDAIRQLVGDCRGPMHILQETSRTKADAVILAHEGMVGPSLCSQLLATYPDLIILSVASDLSTAFTQHLCAKRRDFVTVQREDIVQSLRVAVRDSYSARYH